MKKKEIKNLAKKIAALEFILQKSDDKKLINDSEKEIMRLSNEVDSLEDMIALDEEILKILEK